MLSDLEELRRSGRKAVTVLVDPDKTGGDQRLQQLSRRMALESKIPYLLVGGSLLSQGDMDRTVMRLKEESNLPVYLFPGHHVQLCPRADGILFLSLISGRNPDYLIGQHVVAAPILKKSQLEVIPTGYMLVDPGHPTSASYMSSTHPLPANKPMIAASTAMAGEMLGLRCLYLDAGSGAQRPVPASLINKVRKSTDIPLIVGGGIRSTIRAKEALEAGADMIVVGNGLEAELDLLAEIAEVAKDLNDQLEVHK